MDLATRRQIVSERWDCESSRFVTKTIQIDGFDLITQMPHAE